MAVGGKGESVGREGESSGVEICAVCGAVVVEELVGQAFGGAGSHHNRISALECACGDWIHVAGQAGQRGFSGTALFASLDFSGDNDVAPGFTIGEACGTAIGAHAVPRRAEVGGNGHAGAAAAIGNEGGVRKDGRVEQLARNRERGPRHHAPRAIDGGDGIQRAQILDAQNAARQQAHGLNGGPVGHARGPEISAGFGKDRQAAGGRIEDAYELRRGGHMHRSAKLAGPFTLGGEHKAGGA